MQRSDRWPEDYDPDTPKSRPTSRRNSASLSRRNSTTKKEKESKKKSPLNTTPSSVHSTPKKTGKPQNLDFVVTGRQCLKKSDRANSLPGYNRRPSTESLKTKKLHESPKKVANVSQSSKSRETSLEDDMSLDLSQVSDFEDNHSKYGIKQKFTALATSTPKPGSKAKPRSCSLQSQMHTSRLENSKRLLSFESKSKSSQESNNSLYKTSSSASNYKHGVSTELDYSSVSPEYSGQSSADLSPRVSRQQDLVQSPRTIEQNLSSCCSWQDCSEMERTAMGDRDGEWSSFWANYNNSLSKVPVKNYYDQCPTPYRTENFDLADLGNASEFSTDGSKNRTPDNLQNVNYIICNEGLHLTPRETQNMIKCAHILGNVLSKAIERRCREKDKVEEKVKDLTGLEDEEIESKKKTLTLDLKETLLPTEVRLETKCETVTTQTDISLPNTKSAPRIFEKILRQLSKTSLDEGLNKMAENKSADNKDEGTEKSEAAKQN
ncbi:hypothetical protein evm_006151 [Chilo suppressalis]|nr:hypothetical protein evm_006151 [Chilo suppressalis]